MKRNITHLSFLTAAMFLLAGLFPKSSFGQCGVNAGNDTAIYYGYAPLACVQLSASPTGTPPFTYLWSNGDTTASTTVCDTADVVYMVSVTDSNGCVAIDTVNVTVLDVTCGSGKVLVCHIPPGNPANAHTICISASGVPAHLAHGCHLGACAGSPPPPPPTCSLDLGVDTSACGSFVLDAGSGAAAYLWSDSSTTQTLTITASGTYFATVTDSAGCVAVDSILITIFDVPVANAGADTTLTGPGCVLLTGSASGGATPYALLWSNGSTTDTTTVCDTATASYIFMVTDSNGCVASDEVQVIVPPIENPSVCDSGKVEICHIPLGNPMNMHTICVGQAAVAAHLAHGDVLGPCANGNRTGETGKLSAVPNPFYYESLLEFTLNYDGPARVEIMDLSGMIIKVLYNAEADAYTPYTVQFAPDHLTGGIYLARIISGNHPPVIHKMIFLSE